MNNLFLRQKKKKKSSRKKKTVAKIKTLKNRYKRIIKGGMFSENDKNIGDKISVENESVPNSYVNATIESIYDFDTDNYETKKKEIVEYLDLKDEEQFDEFTKHTEKIEKKGKMTKIYFIKYDDKQTYQKDEFDPQKALDYLKKTLEKQDLDQESLDDYIKNTYDVELFKDKNIIQSVFRVFLKNSIGKDLNSIEKQEFYTRTTQSLTLQKDTVFVYKEGFNFKNRLY